MKILEEHFEQRKYKFAGVSLEGLINHLRFIKHVEETMTLTEDMATDIMAVLYHINQFKTVDLPPELLTWLEKFVKSRRFKMFDNPKMISIW